MNQPTVADPLILCQWSTCRKHFRLSSFDDHWREHTADDTRQGCLWRGCPSQARNTKQHVYDGHLGIRYICRLCYRADFAAQRSLARHQEQNGGCQAASTGPVFCAHCGLSWPSQAGINQHAPFCMFAGSGQL